MNQFALNSATINSVTPNAVVLLPSASSFSSLSSTEHTLALMSGSSFSNFDTVGDLSKLSTMSGSSAMSLDQTATLTSFRAVNLGSVDVFFDLASTGTLDQLRIVHLGNAASSMELSSTATAPIKITLLPAGDSTMQLDSSGLLSMRGGGLGVSYSNLETTGSLSAVIYLGQASLECDFSAQGSLTAIKYLSGSSSMELASIGAIYNNPLRVLVDSNLNVVRRPYQDTTVRRNPS